MLLRLALPLAAAGGVALILWRVRKQRAASSSSIAKRYEQAHKEHSHDHSHAKQETCCSAKEKAVHSQADDDLADMPPRMRAAMLKKRAKEREEAAAHDHSHTEATAHDHGHGGSGDCCSGGDCAHSHDDAGAHDHSHAASKA